MRQLKVIMRNSQIRVLDSQTESWSFPDACVHHDDNAEQAKEGVKHPVDERLEDEVWRRLRHRIGASHFTLHIGTLIMQCT